MSWYFLREDRILIEQLHRFKGYGAKTLVKEGVPREEMGGIQCVAPAEETEGNWHDQPSTRQRTTAMCEDAGEY